MAPLPCLAGLTTEWAGSVLARAAEQLSTGSRSAVRAPWWGYDEEPILLAWGGLVYFTFKNEREPSVQTDTSPALGWVGPGAERRCLMLPSAMITGAQRFSSLHFDPGWEGDGLEGSMTAKMPTNGWEGGLYFEQESTPCLCHDVVHIPYHRDWTQHSISFDQ